MSFHSSTWIHPGVADALAPAGSWPPADSVLIDTDMLIIWLALKPKKMKK